MPCLALNHSISTTWAAIQRPTLELDRWETGHPKTSQSMHRAHPASLTCLKPCLLAAKSNKKNMFPNEKVAHSTQLLHSSKSRSTTSSLSFPLVETTWGTRANWTVSNSLSRLLLMAGIPILHQVSSSIVMYCPTCYTQLPQGFGAAIGDARPRSLPIEKSWDPSEALFGVCRRHRGRDVCRRHIRRLSLRRASPKSWASGL